MIKYALKCDKSHSFESWFQNGAAYDGLRAGGHVACPHCGSTEISKSLMAPEVRPSRDTGKTDRTVPDVAARAPAATPAMSAPSPEVQAEITAALAKLRARVESESDYVGDAFVKEARAMYLGEAPERSIYGEARLEDAKALLEDGVPVMPLPFTPTRKVN